MTHPVWPSELPQRVLRDGYSESLRDGRLFSRMSGGAPKVRRRFSSSTLPVSASIHVDYDQKSRLERFWNEETQGGSLPFIIPDQTHDGLALLDGSGNPILDGSGNPILISTNWLALFGEEAPKVTPWGIQFTVAFNLVVLP